MTAMPKHPPIHENKIWDIIGRGEQDNPPRIFVRYLATLVLLAILDPEESTEVELEPTK